jgi:hypothetical protein
VKAEIPGKEELTFFFVDALNFYDTINFMIHSSRTEKTDGLVGLRLVVSKYNFVIF